MRRGEKKGLFKELSGSVQPHHNVSNDSQRSVSRQREDERLYSITASLTFRLCMEIYATLPFPGSLLLKVTRNFSSTPDYKFYTYLLHEGVR